MKVLKVKNKVSTFLDKLHLLCKESELRGEDAPSYDLCKITNNGASVFCENNLGIQRKEMPQLKGKVTEDSWAFNNLYVDENIEVNSEDVFRKLLESKGLNIYKSKVPATMLKATQNQLIGSKVAGMINSLKENPNDENITKPIFISKEGYILDGHHRWAAIVGLDIHPDYSSVLLDVDIVDLSIDDLLTLANNFVDKIGIQKEEAKIKSLNSVLDNRIKYAVENYNKLPDKTKEELKPVLDILFDKSDKWKEYILKYIQTKNLVRWEALALCDIFSDLHKAGKSITKELAKKELPSELVTVDEMKSYFKKGEKLKLTKLSASDLTKFKVGDNLEITSVTNAGVWANHIRLKFEFCLIAPSDFFKFKNVEENIFTYVTPHTEMTFSKS